MPSGKKLKVGLYARVSTIKESQDESPDGQFDDLRSYFARRQDCEIVMEKHDRVSGAKGERDRKGLAEIMAAARAGKLDLIGVTRTDRLFRSIEKWITTSRELQEIGVGIVYTDHPELDPSSSSGWLMTHVFALVSEFFRREYGRKALERKAAAEARGKHCARPREVVQEEALRLIHTWVMAAGTAGEKDALSWRQMSDRLARSHFLQPARVIKTTGRMREARPWPPGSLWGAYRAWLERTPPEMRVQKSPPHAAALSGAVAGSK